MTKPKNRDKTPAIAKVPDKDLQFIEESRGIWVLTDISYGVLQMDPDAPEGRGRLDPETGDALVTPQGPRSKQRHTELNLGAQDIYLRRGGCKETWNREIAESLGYSKFYGKNGDGSNSNKSIEESRHIVGEACRRFFDIRCYGNTFPSNPGATCRGAIQTSMGVTVVPSHPFRMSITSGVVNNENEQKKQSTKDGKIGANQMMGAKWVHPYDLFRQYHIYSPADAKRNGFTVEDYERFLRILPHIYDDDRSSSRQTACVRRIIELRRCHIDAARPVDIVEALDSIRVYKRDPNSIPRSFQDFVVEIPREIGHETPGSSGWAWRDVLPAMQWTYDSDLAAQ